jgi:hypothetical protein
MGRRPHTIEVDGEQVMNLNSDQLRDMSDDELRSVCEYAGVATKPGWSRTRILTELYRAATGAENI